METATLAGGCFWCVEAIFKRLIGVESVESGYSGGDVPNPTYEEVSSGRTNHAEAIQIKFNPEKISYDKILDVFWHTHDPTTLNQQGNDIGTQYRSEVFYENGEQKKIAEESKKRIEEEKVYKDRIVTKISPFKNFYKAEAHHQNYYDRNQEYPYCTYVIDPKIQKLMKEYSKNIKEEYIDS